MALVKPKNIPVANLASAIPATAYVIKPGALVQTQSNKANAVTIATTTWTDIVSLTITVQYNDAYLNVFFSGDANADTAGAWKRVGIFIDGVQQMYSITSTSVASYQEVVGLVGKFGPYGIGNHTVAIKAQQGAGTTTFSEDGNSGNQLVVMEVKS